MQGKHILYLAGWWPDTDSLAGVFIREQALAISPGHTLDVVHLCVERCLAWPRVSVQLERDGAMRVYRVTVRTPVRRAGLFERTVRWAYERLILRLIEEHGPFDLVHIQVRTEVTEQALRVNSLRSIPVVITEHNSHYHQGIARMPEPARTRERERIRDWFSDARIKTVMPVSKDLAQVLIRDFGVKKEIIRVIPNIAAAVFQPGDPLAAPPFRILLAALWRPPKDPDVFMDAIQLLPAGVRASLRVDWAGAGPDGERIQQRWATELKDTQAHFHGNLRKKELATLMQKAHLFVLPTRADNLPCVVLESLCCGTPVLSMAVNGVPELIDQSNGILVPPADPLALANAIQKFVAGAALFDRASIARHAIALYSAGSVSAQIEAVYLRATRV